MLSKTTKTFIAAFCQTAQNAGTSEIEIFPVAYWEDGIITRGIGFWIGTHFITLSLDASPNEEIASEIVIHGLKPIIHKEKTNE